MLLDLLCLVYNNNHVGQKYCLELQLEKLPFLVVGSKIRQAAGKRKIFLMLVPFIILIGTTLNVNDLVGKDTRLENLLCFSAIDQQAF